MVCRGHTCARFPVWAALVAGCGGETYPTLDRAGPIPDGERAAPQAVAASSLVAFAPSEDAGIPGDPFPAPDRASSSTLAFAPGAHLLVVHPDEGTVSRVVLDYVAPGVTEVERVDELFVGGEPTRIAAAGDRVLVTLRAQRSVAVVHDAPDGPVLERVVEVGAEPFGIVSSAAAGVAYVALSTEDTVVELDLDTLERRRAWRVPGEPRWLAMSEDAVFVGAARGSAYHGIDRDTGAVRRYPLPAIIGACGGTLSSRVSGDLELSADASRLAIPAQYADTAAPTTINLTTCTPFSATATVEGWGGTTTATATTFDDPGANDVTRLDPAVVIALVDGRGVAVGAFAALASVWDEEFDTVLRSPIASVAWSGDEVLATMEASDAVVALTPPSPPDIGRFAIGAVEWRHATPTPRGIAIAWDGTPWTASAIDRTVVGHGDVRTVAESASSSLDPLVERGRELFHTAVNTDVSAPGSGASCSTCHVEGREDGFVWTTANGRRGTLSLAGTVSETAPVTWEGTVASVAEEAEITTTTRLGGDGLSPADLDALVAYIDSRRLPELPAQDPAAVARGRIAFELAGCHGCHAGPRFTDGRNHTVLGDVPTNTPALNGLAASAPYFHDGSAATLEDVLDATDRGVMANTRHLTDAQKLDLLAYLRSL